MNGNSNGDSAVAEAAKRYRLEGYAVEFHPPPNRLPKEARSYEPDFVARRGKENVAVEVKEASDRTSAARFLGKMAEIFRGIPGWRLDVIVVSPEETKVRSRRFLTAAALRRRLQAAGEVAHEAGDYPAAVVLLWTAVEGALRSQLQDDENQEVFSPQRLLKEAYSRGTITKREWENLVSVTQIRNEVVHGELSRLITKGRYEKIHSLITRLLDRLNEPASKAD